MSRPRRGRDRPWDVVLAEDDDDYAHLIGMALERAAKGAVEIRRARSGQEAVALLEEAAPDLLLLDLKMPGQTGHEVLERVKADEGLRRVPVAVLTSSDRDDDMARAYGLGGNHFITKPENPRDLEASLARLLANLRELGGVRRGADGLEATARTAHGPSSARTRNLVVGVAVVVLLGALLLYALAAGIF